MTTTTKTRIALEQFRLMRMSRIKSYIRKPSAKYIYMHTHQYSTDEGADIALNLRIHVHCEISRGVRVYAVYGVRLRFVPALQRVGR